MSIKKTGLAVLFWLTLLACEKKEDIPPVETAGFKKTIEETVNNGEILTGWNKEGAQYVFQFEKEKIEIPVQAISGITEKAEEWKTVLTFSDQSELVIPSRGGSLDFMVKDLTLNPSGYNPLAARVEVLLPATGRVKITVHGKNGSRGTISHLFRGREMRQHLPVLGLYANYTNQVDIIFTDLEGNERGKTRLTLPTDPLVLPGSPDVFVKVAKSERMEPGVNLVSYPGQSEIDTSCPYMLDEDGEVRWVLLLKNSPDLARFSQSIGLKRTAKGTFISGDMAEDRIVELDVLGNLVKQWDLKKLGYSFHHEVTEAKNGHFLVTVSKINAVLSNGKPRINDFIIELNPTTGAVVKEWDLATMLDTARYQKPDGITPPEFAQSPGNWAHNNSITESGDNLLATLRYQGIFNYTPSGKVNWIISPHRNWGKAYQPLLLTPVDRSGQPITDEAVLLGEKTHPDFEWSWGPHTPVVLPNGNFIVFDNGYNRNFVNNMMPGVQNYSRAVEYQVDEVRKTVRQVWEYGKSRGNETFSQALSGVQYLPSTGHVLFCPGMGTLTQKGNGGHVIEVDPRTGEVVFEVQITSPTYTAFHRVTRMPLYPENL